jgi:hypothetical protein
MYLGRAAQFMDIYERESGRKIYLCVEPEPGCILQRSSDVVHWWEAIIGHGVNVGMEEVILRRLRVCHDICHSAVMFEPQEEAFAAYEAAGISVGKMQISSALCAKGAAARDLARFVEPRYLHQTCVNGSGGVSQFEDLPHALAAGADGEWRVHFHVPVHLPEVGALATTQDQIWPAIRLALEHGVKHFEVETYAWGVLPMELQPAELADGIADELRWVMEGRA